MNKGVAIVGGVGVGAALMYFLDPDRGRQRRAIALDKAESAANKLADKTVKMNRDLRNRAYGFAVEARNLFQHEEVADDVLENRIRAKLGRVCSNVGAIDVTANNGVVALNGPIIDDEEARILRALRLVRGVKDVRTEHNAGQPQNDQPGLQGAASIAH